MISADFHPSDDLLVGFALDELEPAQRDAVDAHLDECDRCQRDYAATTDTLALLALAAPPVEPPAHLRARVLEVPRESPGLARCGRGDGRGRGRESPCRRCWSRLPSRSRCTCRR